MLAVGDRRDLHPVAGEVSHEVEGVFPWDIGVLQAMQDVQRPPRIERCASRSDAAGRLRSTDA